MGMILLLRWSSSSRMRNCPLLFIIKNVVDVCGSPVWGCDLCGYVWQICGVLLVGMRNSLG
jgi:hypothetical protein